MRPYQQLLLTQPKLSMEMRKKLPGRKKPQERHFKKRSPLLGWLGVVQDLQVGKKRQIRDVSITTCP